MKINESEVVELINTYGKDCTLETILKNIQNDNKKLYICPKCNGKGIVLDKFKVEVFHPTSPDYGTYYWTTEERVGNIECNLCNGKGTTDKQYKPRMVQDGWDYEGAK